MIMDNNELDTDSSLDTSVDAAADTSIDTPVDTSTQGNDGPKSMLEAIEGAIPGEEAKKEEAKPEDAPEGVSEKAQNRFQQLANEKKELQSKYDDMAASVEPFREALQSNGVQREQFDMAVGVIGMMNRGDFEGALKALDEQRRLISLHMGKPLPGVDALVEFPDLRAKVEAFQLDEETAHELAKQRHADAQRQQIQERTQQQRQAKERERQSQEQQQQEFQAGTKAVDDFCKKMMKEDLDYAKVEAILLPRISKGLLKGVPPERFAEVVQDTYEMIKASAGSQRTAHANINSLRPVGAASPTERPKNMHEAMWGGTT